MNIKELDNEILPIFLKLGKFKTNPKSDKIHSKYFYSDKYNTKSFSMSSSDKPIIF